MPEMDVQGAMWFIAGGTMTCVIYEAAAAIRRGFRMVGLHRATRGPTNPLPPKGGSAVNRSRYDKIVDSIDAEHARKQEGKL